MGAVTDASGGAVSGATVTVIDVERGINRSLTTDDAGEYNAPNLTPVTLSDSRNLVVGQRGDAAVDGRHADALAVTPCLHLGLVITPHDHAGWRASLIFDI